MPFAIDENKMKSGPDQLLSMDPAKPPVRSIPHGEFPRVVYMHPNENFKVIEHRNAKFELVGEEVVPTEHLTKVVACAEHEGSQEPIVKCENCKKALDKALKEGWDLKPYIAPPLPDRNAGLYGASKQA